MTLLLILATLLLGGGLAWVVGGRAPLLARSVCIAALLGALGLALSLAASTRGRPVGSWRGEVAVPWFPRFGIGFHLGVDGLSLLLVLLTLLLGIVAVAASWTEVTTRVGAFHFCLMGVLAGVVGVFAALDLFLFYFFWELMLVPMYFLIAVWGHEERVSAALQFFIFTQAGSLLMLVSIVTLAVLHARAAGTPSFDYVVLRDTPRALGALSMPLMLGFFVAFAVKLPAFPLHTWLPSAHTEAPTGGSVILAGLLLKTGAYGMLRLALPLFPEASRAFSPYAMGLGVIGILYGALLALAQTDFKRLVAYTSVSHLGFVLLAIYSFERLATEGAVLEMICHGLSTGGLFVLAGALQERLHTRDLRRFSGLSSVAPRIGAAGLLLALATLGLPGLGNFVAEFLILLGTFRRSLPLAALATAGLVAATVYSLSLVQRALHGGLSLPDATPLADLGAREVAVLGGLVLLLLGLGLYPQPVLDELATLAPLAWLGGGHP
jgi:NADH-quinone oxidoreductase subunit M